ncbi:sensor domain-containing diguanylate cyclase [Paenibacillus sp. IB182496]|uniref:Sensor domain-containing diguanylate cyclase n=2 Tax=Paenibacillus sabuli TaxID=2772509 RepID=A0A927BSY2_9BACL|nr:sensor domain-containing diguanylate cyclase [Paenibacillus sabuli]
MIRKWLGEVEAPPLEELLEASLVAWAAEAAQLEMVSRGICMLGDADGQAIALQQGELCADPVIGARLRELLAKSLGEAAASGQYTAAHLPMEEGPGLVAAARPIYAADGAAMLCILAIAARGEAPPSSDLMTAAALHFRSRFDQRYTEALLQRLLARQSHAERATEREAALFDSTKRLHDQINVTSVLRELVITLETLYPDAHVDLLLSQDHANADARVKPLVFKHGANDLCARAFVEGRAVTEAADGQTHVAVPMTGKQAVYGVIRLVCETPLWERAWLPEFQMLANTAGSAFENAKLYEQSNLLISELQLINELTKRLNQSLRLSEIFKLATTDLLQIFEADYCCLLQFDKKTEQFVVMSANHPGLDSDLFPKDYGFCGTVYQTREPLIVSDYAEKNTVPSKLMQLTGSRSLIASPIVVNSDVVGVILVSHRSANFFSYDNYKLLQVLSTHVGLAITNASLHAEVRRMVITDNLTGLHARHYLNERIQEKQRSDPSGSLILVDIDHFKRINDTYGHQVGDEILIQVGRIVRACIRETDIAARWGGEELAVYLPRVRTDQGYRIAERIRSQVEAQTSPTVTSSCGVSEWTFEDDKISVESLFYRADMALYEAKNNGRNRVFVG